MEQATIQQCECWGDADDHKDSVVVTWADGTTAEISVRCPGNDVDPYMELPEVATTGIFWTESPPVRGYTCNLRRLTDGLWILDMGEMDEQPQVVAIRGSSEEAVSLWLGEGEAIAPGTRRLLAAHVTRSLDGVPTDNEGSHPQHLFAGDLADTEPTLGANIEEGSAEMLQPMLQPEIVWVTSADTSPDSWLRRLEWWRAQDKELA